MSLATLKKKSQTMYGVGINSSTVSRNGFYLNGNKRVVGSVNQTNLAKSVTRTPFKGSEPMGHGGGSRCRVSGRAARKCGGSGYLKAISNSGSVCTPQTLIKASTKNHKGLIHTKYKWIFSKYPNYWVKHLNEPENTSASSYMESLKNEVITNCGIVSEVTSTENTSETYIECMNKHANRYHIGTKCKSVSKDVLGADTYENHLSNLKSKCLEIQHIPYAITKNATVY